MRKKSTDQSWGRGISLRIVGNATNAIPGPGENCKPLCYSGFPLDFGNVKNDFFYPENSFKCSVL